MYGDRWEDVGISIFILDTQPCVRPESTGKHNYVDGSGFFPLDGP